MFHVALKYQYLHTSAMYFCAGYIEDPWGWGQQPSGGKPWWADNDAHCGIGDYAPPPPGPPSAPASGAPPRVVPARVPVPVVVVPDNDGNEGGGKKAGVSGVPDVRNHPPQPSHPKKSVKPKPMPDSLKRPKIKAKPRPKPPATPPPTHSGVSGTKRKNSRSPSAGVKRKAVRLEAAPASSAPSHSGVSSANYISLQKPLEGKTFKIYSGGKNQASNRDFQSPS